MSRPIDVEKAIEIIEAKQKELCPVGRYGRNYVYGLDREKYDAWEEIIDALENLDTLAPPNKWVSVDERLPEDDVPEHKMQIAVLVLTDRKVVKIKNRTYHPARFYYGKFCPERWDWGTFNDDHITHWTPLPAPPDKDNNVPIKAPNEPLTLEQLREMDGEPVWVVLVDEKFSGLNGWYLVHHGSAYLARIDDWELDYDKYGVEWLAYRRPPEGEEK